MVYKILVVEDENQIREIVGKYLERENFEVILAKDGFEGLAMFNEMKPHLIILDVMMPGISGFEVLKEIRIISEVPVIMLTAKQEEIDKINGFRLGADDYISKPFSPNELVMRVYSVLKRVYKKIDEKELLIIGELQLDIKKHKLMKNNIEIEITTKEYQLLKTFFDNQGLLLTREQLIEKAFGYEYEGFDRNIDSYIKKLRAKIEDDSKESKYLKTKYGAGYIFGGDKDEY